jgi:hypothetical protein
MRRYLMGLARLALRSAKNFLTYCYWTPWYLRFILCGDRKCFDVFTHLTRIERLLLYRLAISLPRNCTIVEIGSYIGASSSFLASAAKEKSGILYCVDTWKNEEMSEGSRDTYAEFIQNTKPYENCDIS